jgi:8-oxo-dGTP pyrophosphatase MutT (NUDIX family)
MAQYYKIHFNDSVLFITDSTENIHLSFERTITAESEWQALFTSEETLFDGHSNGDILILDDNPAKVREALQHATQAVPAAGGIVYNEAGALLMIHRRGKWDLPKGKVEQGEDWATAAVREVEEETGILIAGSDTAATVTFHCYTLRGKKCLKETHWFRMKAKPGQTNTVPQTEEDIEEAKWVVPEEVSSYAAISYRMIGEMLTEPKP